jgi:hypothetical protein
LWQVEHPYYCETSRWCEHQGSNRFGSWAEFCDTSFYGGDRDQNLLVRWDWEIRPDYDGVNGGRPVGELLLFFVLQRKPIFAVNRVTVSPRDEPAVREWLAGCAQTMRATWAPLLDGAVVDVVPGGG